MTTDEKFPPGCPVFSVKDGVFGFTEGRLFVGEGPSTIRQGYMRVQPIDAVDLDDDSAFVFVPGILVPHTPAAVDLLRAF